MAGKAVTLGEFAIALKKLAKTEMRTAMVNGLQWAALRGKNYIMTEAIPGEHPPPVDRTTYKAAWQVQPLPDGAMLHNDELHAIFIEYGVRAENVRPGRAMIEALTEWVIRKRLAEDPKEAQSIAWAIANAARKRGIFNRPGKGNPETGGGLGILSSFVRDRLPLFIKEEVERELQRAMTSTLEGS